jgi:NAD(P)-dependent dehydrogenase (short-subunit alcohol dehydrogenase family)
MANPLALVTGASSRIGLSHSKELASRGYDIIACSAGSRLPDAIEEIKAFATTVTEAQADLSTTEGVENLWGGVAALAIEHSPHRRSGFDSDHRVAEVRPNRP